MIWAMERVFSTLLCVSITVKSKMTSLTEAVSALQQGEVIAYPTEGVFGIGCDPDNDEAIQNLINIKQRDPQKGLILIAASFEQLAPYLDLSVVSPHQLQVALDSWPGPYTWIIPASPLVGLLVKGGFDSVAVRVSAHPVVIKLCNQFGKPITSTSANLSNHPSCITYQEVQKQLGDRLSIVIEESVGGREGPSEIKDILTGERLR